MPSSLRLLIARELCIGHATVKRAEKFARGVDALSEVSPELQRTLLIVKMYEVRKNRAGGQTGNKNAEKQMSQNETVVSSDRKKSVGAQDGNKSAEKQRDQNDPFVFRENI